jgi:hypothetical protein
MDKLSFPVAVVVERTRLDNPWQSVRWRPVGLLPDDGVQTESRVLVEHEGLMQRLHPGFVLETFRDEAEGYFLNVDSPEPAVWVTLRTNEDASDAWPHLLTLSYNEAARWMDAQENVERLTMPLEIFEALRAWVAVHYQPPQKKNRIRPRSFESKEGRYKSDMG